MTTNTPIANIPTPDLTDPPNGPAQLQAANLAVDKQVVPQYTTTIARDAANTSPALGQKCVVTDANPYGVREFTYQSPSGSGTPKWIMNRCARTLRTTQTTSNNATGVHLPDTNIYLEAGGIYSFHGQFLGNAGNGTARLSMGVASAANNPGHIFTRSSLGMQSATFIGDFSVATGYSTAGFTVINNFDNGGNTVSGVFWGSIQPATSDFFRLFFTQQVATVITTTCYAIGTWWAVDQVG